VYEGWGEGFSVGGMMVGVFIMILKRWKKEKEKKNENKGFGLGMGNEFSR